jgi:thymidine phosphorylase
MFLPAELIRQKRNGAVLDTDAISAFVNGITDGSVSDAQIGAFAMAVYFRGMNQAEQVALTLAMRDSGSVMSWPDVDGPVLDKHSTGGVGDMVSLMLGPMLAACGAYVPSISGRGLGHTGGTLDKLESIPGYNGTPETEKFRQCVHRHGVAIVGQTADLAPADQRFYAMRDVTATVESIPLIVASILSKKLAEGLDGLLVDVKTGNGAFMREDAAARDLAGAITTVSRHAGVPCEALITDMNQPLAWSAGNALEVRETIDYLTGERRHPRLHQVVMASAMRLLNVSGLAGSAVEARSRLESALDSGQAADRFSRMVSSLGGPVDLVEQMDRYFEPAPVIRPVLAGCRGFVTAMETRQIGVCVLELGGGRARPGEAIDSRVGLSGLCSQADVIEPDTPLAMVHAASDDDWAQAAETLRDAITIGDQAPETPKMIHQAFSMEKK